jgi:hypothetical protein
MFSNLELELRLAQFIKLVGKWNSWGALPGKSIMTRGADGILWLRAICPVRHSTILSGFVELTLGLRPHTAIEGAFFVACFGVQNVTAGARSLHSGLLMGPTLLTHHGKYFPTSQDLQAKTLRDHCWIIRSSADLQRLFEEYDKLAKIWNLVPLFNMP